MVVIFDDELEDDAVSEVCDRITDAVYSLREGDKVDVYFSTNGGPNKNRIPILNLFIKYQDYINIYIHNIMLSNGFELLIELLDENIPVYMTKEFVYSMVHNTDASLRISRLHGFEKGLTKFIQKQNQNMLKRLKILGLTDEQLDIVKRGDDIYFTREETLKLFPNIIKEK